MDGVSKEDIVSECTNYMEAFLNKILIETGLSLEYIFNRKFYVCRLLDYSNTTVTGSITTKLNPPPRTDHYSVSSANDYYKIEISVNDNTIIKIITFIGGMVDIDNCELKINITNENQIKIHLLNTILSTLDRYSK